MEWHHNEWNASDVWKKHKSYNWLFIHAFVHLEKLKISAIWWAVTWDILRFLTQEMVQIRYIEIIDISINFEKFYTRILHIVCFFWKFNDEKTKIAKSAVCQSFWCFQLISVEYFLMARRRLCRKTEKDKSKYLFDLTKIMTAISVNILDFVIIYCQTDYTVGISWVINIFYLLSANCSQWSKFYLSGTVPFYEDEWNFQKVGKNEYPP